MKKPRLWLAVIGIGLAVLSPVALTARAEKIPAMAPMPDELSGRQRSALAQRAQALETELAQLHAAAAAFNAKPAGNQSDSEYNAVQEQRTRYIRAVKEFNEDLAAAQESARIIKGMNALAQKLAWSTDEQDRLARALDKLGSDGDLQATSGEIIRTWSDVLARSDSREFEQEASQGAGVGFPGAGTQTAGQDCAIFALANAAGLPYGVVAARATKLIQEGEWRAPAQRANPEDAITQHGLNGGEVVMLAEALGQAEVVPSGDFARVIQAGRPVLVNVVASGGNLNSGHEVVLTGTFQHGGETWYVMMDSYQGPVRRLYLNARELNTMLQENGVAFRAEPKTTPILFR